MKKMVIVFLHDNSVYVYISLAANLVFPFLVLLNLSNYFKYGSSFLTDTGINYVPVSILK